MASRVDSSQQRKEMEEDLLLPALEDAIAKFDEDLEEIPEQATKQMARVEELRLKRLNEPDSYYGEGDRKQADTGPIYSYASTCE